MREAAWVESNYAGLAGRADPVAGLNGMRERALSRFLELGIPAVSDEEWRFTNLSAIAETPFKLAAESGSSPQRLSEARINEEGAIELVFVNGFYAAGLSSPPGEGLTVRAVSLAGASKRDAGLITNHLGSLLSFEHKAFAALNTAFFRDGALVVVPDGVKMGRPVHLIHITEPGAEAAVTHPRSLILIGADAEARVIESYSGPAGRPYLTNPAVEILVGANAHLDHVKLQDEGNQARHIALNRIALERDSRYSSNVISLGAALMRNDIHTALKGEGSEVQLNGLVLAGDDQHIDNFTEIEHAQARARSQELYKVILDQRASAVFTGRIHVRKGAQKTDAIQSNANLLLSEEAKVDTQPQLEIYADDVRCTHSGTVGQIDEDSVFYLRSRGVSAAQARDILIRAFAGDVIDGLPSHAVREKIEVLLRERLRGGHLVRAAESRS